MAESEKKSKLGENIFLIVFFAVIVAVGVLSYLNPGFGEKFSVGSWFGSEAVEGVTFWAAAWLLVVACFLGALVPIPIPYALPLTYFAALWVGKENAWLLIGGLIMISTLSNTVGDFVDYIIGSGAEKVMDKDKENRWSEIIFQKPKVIPWIIMLFAVSPLPDSVLMVPLGMLKYSKKKTFGYMFVGKILMMLIWALAGIFSIDWLIAMAESEGGNGWISGVVLLLIVWIMMLLMMKIKPKEKAKAKPVSGV